MIRIRDPIHGSIRVSASELRVVDHPVFQRLRNIKQLGFTDQAFPGATHTRYSHGLGALEVATRMFDAIFPLERGLLPLKDRVRLRQAVRLGLMLHDIGHAPASHASERAMPNRSALGLSCFSGAALNEQADHEDYTLLLLLKSSLSQVFEDNFAAGGVEAETVAHLVSGRFPEQGERFVVGGVDYYPVLSQLVSGELDADRMDYLQRDSFFTGVSYGKFDQPWLLENLSHHVVDDRAYLALYHRAVFAFEDFLLSRYHMFVSIYYHYISVGMETMLGRFYDEAPEDFVLPDNAEDYIRTDDVTLWSALRRSKNRWAKRIAGRETFRRILEVNADAGLRDVDDVGRALSDAGVEHFISRDRGVLSKYYERAHAKPIYVNNRAMGRVVPIEDYSQIFERYAKPTPLVRVYAHPKQVIEAKAVVQSVINSPGALFRMGG